MKVKISVASILNLVSAVLWAYAGQVAIACLYLCLAAGYAARDNRDS